MIILVVIALSLIVSVDQYHDNQWKYVGYHECNQVGVVEQTKARVYPAEVDGFKPYILFKQKNEEGSYVVSCVLEKEEK